MIGIAIPLNILKIAADICMFITMWMVFMTGSTPRFAPYFFWVFNISGFFFVAIGFREEIMQVAKGGGFLIFVSYILLSSFMIDQIPSHKNKKKEKNDKK